MTGLDFYQTISFSTYPNGTGLILSNSISHSQ